MINSFIPPPEGTFVVEPISGLTITSIDSPVCAECEFDAGYEKSCNATMCSADRRTGRKSSIVIEKNRYLTLKMTGELDGIRGS